MPPVHNAELLQLQAHQLEQPILIREEVAAAHYGLVCFRL
jgi:hypothetical protein